MPQKTLQTNRPLIPLSFIAEYAYCPRSTYYLLTDAPRVRDENTYIQDGRAAHRTVDEPYVRHKGAVRIRSALRIYSRKHGIIGKVDVVEFFRDNTMVPVEFKRGARRTNHAHKHQLALQALCLQEMFPAYTVTYGAVFFAADHRRQRYELSARDLTAAADLATAVHERLHAGAPQPQDFPMHRDPRCKGCCFYDLCYL